MKNQKSHSPKRYFLKAALGGLLGLLAMQSAHAQLLLNLQLSYGLTPTYSGAAAIGEAGDIWNNIGNPTPDTFVPSTNLIYSDGSSAGGITISGVNYNYSGYAPGTGNTLMDYYVGQNLNASNSEFTISGLNPGDLYNLYVYSNSGHYGYNSGSFSIGGSPVQSTTGGGFGVPVFSPVYDYVVFNNVVVDSFGKLTLNQIAQGPAGTYNILNGIQLQAVPEPGVLYLLLGGATFIALVEIRRRNMRLAGS